MSLPPASLFNPTATLECIAKICPCKMAVLQGPVISVMSVGSAHNSLCYRVCSYKCRCRVIQVRQPREKRLLAPFGVMEAFHREQFPLDSVVGLI